MFRMIKGLIGFILIIIVFIMLLGYFSNPTTLHAAQGYGKQAENGLKNIMNNHNSSSSETSSSSSILMSNNSSASNSSESSLNNGTSATPAPAAIQKRQLTQAYAVMGAGVNQQNMNALKSVLGVSNNVTTLTTNASDLEKYINLDVPNSQIHSSASIIPGAQNSGVNVVIKDFNGENNITTITPSQYGMVATMAGLKNVTITVSSDIPIGGQGALGGLYVALAADGIPVSAQNTQVANGMLSSTTQAINDSKNPTTYAPKLSGAVLNASGQISNGTNPQTALNNSLEKAGIANQTNANDKEAIVNQLQEFKNTPLAKVKGYSKGIQNTASRMMNNQYTAHAKDMLENLANDSSFWNKLKNAFSNGLLIIRNVFASIGNSN